MDDIDASDVLVREPIEADPDDVPSYQWMPVGSEPSPLELAHLMAELNFLRAQLMVLRIEVEKLQRGEDPHSSLTLAPDETPES